jgi:hypothetical protein
MTGARGISIKTAHPALRLLGALPQPDRAMITQPSSSHRAFSSLMTQASARHPPTPRSILICSNHKTMEALAVIGSISSVVQLIECSGKCISETVELYRSADGVLDGNTAIEFAVNRPIVRRDKVETIASSVAGASLQDLCVTVADTSSQLLNALQSLKVQGKNSNWKSVPKAIRSVWSKDEVQDLERRLGSFRDQLNLHIVGRTRFVSSISDV